MKRISFVEKGRAARLVRLARTRLLQASDTVCLERAWMLVPEHGFDADAQTVLENPGLGGLLDHRVPQDMPDYW